MALRNSQTVAEVYLTGGESHRNTQTMAEVYQSVTEIGGARSFVPSGGI